MKNYELTLILAPTLGEEETNDTVGQLVSFLQDQGGLLSNQSIVRNVRLAYPIAKQTEGTLATLAFTLSPEKLPEVEKKVGETSSLLRHMVITKVAKKATEPRRAEVGAAAPVIEKEAPVKADAKEIDEKLKEIFNEATQQ